MLHIVTGHSRAAGAAMIGIAIWIALPYLRQDQWGLMTRGLLAWDAGCVVFLTLTALMFRPSRDSTIEADSTRQQAGEWTVFAITVAAAVASFGGMVGEFSASKDMAAQAKALHVGLVAVTLFGSWLLTHTVFCLRYANEYYESKPDGGVAEGLKFPGDENPDYWDFFYFALVLGMTFQVSDVNIESRKMRRLATAHGLLSFLFSTVILALSVNIASGLL